ncbi:MAG: DNA polymerase III subunit epsilon, partial [Mariprofundaceae bacterium]|nr:DNA polymerase III subunit epsilon [Mariprofundaceae bacterium]
AIGAPFDKKDALKERGYRWLAGFHNPNGKKGVWSICMADSDAAIEQQWLSEHIYTGKKATYQSKTLTAKERYSVREFEL